MAGKTEKRTKKIVKGGRKQEGRQPLQVDLIIFDLDMTLIDSAASIYQSFLYAFEQNSLPKPSRDAVVRLIGLPLEKIIERLLLQADVPATAELNRVLAETYRKHYLATADKATPLFPGVREVLGHFQDKRLAIITTKQHELTMKLLEQLGLAKYFNVILGAGDYQNPKPDPESVFNILNQTRIPPDRVVIIGDTLYDIEAGKSAGIHTIAVTFGIDSREELKRAKPDFIIDTLRELMGILQ